MDKKCSKCRYCEPNGLGLSGQPECTKLKEECDTAIQYCKE
jgi:hypothetical protein